MRGDLFFPTHSNGTKGIATLLGLSSGDQYSDHARKKSEEAITEKLSSLSRGFIINTMFRSLEHNSHSNQITSTFLNLVQKYAIFSEKYYVLLWCISVILSSCLQDWTLIQQRVFVNDNHQNLSKQCFQLQIISFRWSLKRLSTLILESDTWFALNLLRYALILIKYSLNLNK